MRFSLQREVLLKPLAQVVNVVERRQTLPVLANLLAKVRDGQLSLTGTDLEVELVGRVVLEEAAEPGEITVPARKLMDICKSLPNDALIDIRVDDVQLGHEATVSRVSEEQLFYLQSRGMPEDEAMAMIVRGFIEPIARELPMEYALELNKLIEMSMEGSVG